MLNIVQFATLCVYSRAVDLAKPEMAGSRFTWKESFPRMAQSHVETQWYLANRSPRVLARALKDGTISMIIKEIARDFSVITGRP